MENTNYIYLTIMSILYLAIFILSAIYTIKIFIDSSENPLNKEIDSDKNNYFKNDFSFNLGEKALCKCGNETFVDFCNEDLLLSGCVNIAKNNTLLYFQKDLDECLRIEESIMIENKRLMNIFKLKTSSIHSWINFVIIINFIMMVSTFFIFIHYCCCERCIEKGTDMWDCSRCCCCCQECFCCCFCPIFKVFCQLLCDAWITIFFFAFILICLIFNVIFFSIACYNYDSDDTKNYLDFLDCSNVNKKGFDKYSSINDLYSHFTLMKIFQSIYIVFIVIYLCFTLLMKFVLFAEKKE